MTGSTWSFHLSAHTEPLAIWQLQFPLFTPTRRHWFLQAILALSLSPVSSYTLYSFACLSDLWGNGLPFVHPSFIDPSKGVHFSASFHLVAVRMEWQLPSSSHGAPETRSQECILYSGTPRIQLKLWFLLALKMCRAGIEGYPTVNSTSTYSTTFGFLSFVYSNELYWQVS